MPTQSLRSSSPTGTSLREPRVADTIRRAEALFIAGGDQANYINNWSGTPVQWAINEAIRRGIPVVEPAPASLFWVSSSTPPKTMPPPART